ncbi:MAG: DNA repair protein RecN [Bacteroidales bacterium]|nr:DNA repair protein RecN [Bacteroidales bacterium]
MLTHLHIENYALIRKTDIDFAKGFVAITGETGAGKSIMLGALALLLGQRADTRVLFDTASKCIVEATFQMQNPGVDSLLSSNDVDVDSDGTVLVRREILPTAKSRAFVNDTPVSVNFLKTLGSKLIDIHSQHETLLLGDSGFQTGLIDSLLPKTKGNEGLVARYREAYSHYASLKQQLEALTAEEQQKSKDLDYNRFLFEELESANLQADEQETLEQEAELLANAEEVKQAMAEVAHCLNGEESSVVAMLNFSKSRLSKVANYHAELKALSERIESSLIELQDVADNLVELDERIVYSPERRDEVDERLNLIYRLQRKHNVTTIAELLEIQQQLDAFISSVSDNSRRIKECMEEVDKAYSAVQSIGEQLTAARRKAAAALEHEALPLLEAVGMGSATLRATVEPTATPGPTGCDRITLLFNANKGGTLQELSKAASGGEMSRLMLIIKALTSRAALLPTVIFDEIDAGISGDISVKVGRIMQQMAQGMQVIAITHLPQIAARANQHYKVYKAEEDDSTYSKIVLLNAGERQHEIAVMLSSEPPTAAALQTAQELMNGETKQ